MARFSFDLTDELHRKFKIKAVQEGVDMKEVLLEEIERYVGSTKAE